MKTSHSPKELLDLIGVGERFHRGNDEYARVYKFIERPGRSDNGEPPLVVECSLFGAFPDIYEGLEVFALQTDHRAVAIGLTTCGWAVPHHGKCERDEFDVAPSEHPDRKRVALAFVLTDDNLEASRLVMVETQEVVEESTDSSSSSGQLVDACAMALHFHRADKEHLRELIRDTQDRLTELTTIEDMGFPTD